MAPTNLINYTVLTYRALTTHAMECAKVIGHDAYGLPEDRTITYELHFNTVADVVQVKWEHSGPTGASVACMVRGEFDFPFDCLLGGDSAVDDHVQDVQDEREKGNASAYSR